MFVTDDKFDQVMKKLSKINLTPDSKSEYYSGSKRIPRVTEILSAMIAEPGLMNWSNSLGWKRISYRQFMREAADKGTYSHLAIEKYIRDGHVDINSFGIMDQRITRSVESCLNGFIQWWDRLNEFRDVKVIYLEEPLMHDYFGGTCDCLLDVNGQKFLIDFKTSNHMSYNYALQLAAYRFLLRELKGIYVDRCMVLKLDKENSSYTTYELDMNKPEDSNFMDNCQQTFILLSMAYRMRLSTTEEFHKIFNV